MVRMIAEWEAQAATLLCWPHENTDWAPRLQAIQAEYIQFIAGISQFQNVIILINQHQDWSQIYAQIKATDAVISNLYAIEIKFNDTWIRDFGPISIDTDHGAAWVKFLFDGWGEKYDSHLNNQLVEGLHQHPAFNQITLHKSSLIAEGGNLETDGQATLLSSSTSFDSRSNHLPVKHQIESLLGIQHPLWLDCPPLPGDDTDGHIDTLVRFCRPDTLIYQGGVSHHLLTQLETFKQADGRTYQLITLPAADLIREDNRILPASYANFIFVNDGLIVPAFGVKQDEIARKRLAEHFPDRTIISQKSRNLIWQNGSLHCASMQLPASLAIQFEHLLTF